MIVKGYGDLWSPSLLHASRAVAATPFVLGAKVMLVAAKQIHPGWGHVGMAIKHCDYAVQDTKICVGNL